MRHRSPFVSSLLGTTRQPLIALSLLLFLLSSLTNAAPTVSSNSTTSPDPDVGGTAPSSRSNAAFLLWSIQSLIFGSFLLLFGKRGWRISTTLGLGLVLELVCWVIIVYTLPAAGFSASSEGHTDIIIWAITTAAGLIGAGLGATIWIAGMTALASCGGFALALSIVMMGDNDLPQVARWIIIALFTFGGLLLGPFYQRHFGMALTSSLAGAFLLFLGVDLFINENRGMSLGLRYLFDQNSAHATALTSYHPPPSTRVLLALIWCLSAIFTVFQTWFWRKSPFIRTLESLSEHDIRRMNLNPSLAPTPPNLEPELSEYPGGPITAAMQKRYENASALDDSDSTLRGEKWRGHQMEMSSPDDPPSRPTSIVSTEFANGLRSRPPTFFDMPVKTPPNEIPYVPPPVPPVPASVSGTDMSFNIPIVSVAPKGFHKVAPSDVTVTEVEGGGVVVHSRSSTSSKESRKSWRKPVPQLESSEEGTAMPVPSEGQGIAQASKGFDQGLLSGREVSIAPTNSTPSSGGDISTILGGKFGAPLSTPDLTNASHAIDPRHSITDPSQIKVGTSAAQPQSPVLVSPDAETSGARPSMESEDFYTSSEAGHGDLRTPDLVRGDTPSDDPTSVASLNTTEYLTAPTRFKSETGSGRAGEIRVVN